MKNSAAIIWTTAMLLLAVCINAAEVINAGNYADARRRYNGEWAYPQDPLASNIYSRVKSMYEGHWLSPFDYFLAVRGGGVDLEMPTADFFEFASFVSNNCSAIAADWPTYETNEMVRFTTLSAVGYSGVDNYTNFVDRILALHEGNVNSCGWETVRFLFHPYGTASHNTLDIYYDTSTVSNIIQRVRAIAIQRGDTNLLFTCDFMASGAQKQIILEMDSLENGNP